MHASGADPCDIDLNGDSGIHLTAKYGHIRTAETLLEGGADVRIVNSLGETPIATAAKGDHAALVALFASWAERPQVQVLSVPVSGCTSLWLLLSLCACLRLCVTFPFPLILCVPLSDSLRLVCASLVAPLCVSLSLFLLTD